MDGLQHLRAARAVLCEPEIAISQLVTYLDRATPAAIALWQALAIEPTLTPRLTAYLATWRHVRPLLDGNDLRAMGLPRGPLYSTILTELRAARLDGTVHSRADEETLARQIAQRESGWA